MTRSKKPLISAIVTNYNGWELGLVKDFFTSFLKDSYRSLEIFFVDMASADGSVENVKKHFGKDKRIKIIANPVNNMSAGIDMALKKAKGKYVMFLNNDIYFEKGAIQKMVDFMEKNKNVGEIQGKMVSYFDHKKIDSVGETMDLFGNPVSLGAGEEDKGQYNKLTETLSATQAAALFRRSISEKIGLLDPDYGIGYEDMDMALRLRIAGYKIFYLPEAVVFHRRASSTSRASNELRAQIKFWFNKNRLATIIKNYEISNLFLSLPVVLIIYLATGLFEIFYKRLWRFGFSRFKAIWWMIVNFSTLLKKRKRVQKVRVLSDQEALLPFMAKGRLVEGFKGFLGSKKW